MEKASGYYSIVLRQAPIPAVGGGVHYYWALLDPMGRVVEELHLEAYNRANGRIATFMDILRGGNQLRFLEYGGASHWDERKLQEGKTYFSGAPREAIDRWNEAKRLGRFLNTKDIDYRAFDYNLFGATYAPNSNAGAFSLGMAMGFDLERLPSPPGEPYLVPGWPRDFGVEYPDAPKSRFRTERSRDMGAMRRDVRNETSNVSHVPSVAYSGSTQPTAYRGRASHVTAMTPAAAQKAIETAKADYAFGKRYVSNDREAVDYLHALHRAAYPEPGATVGPRVRPDLVDATDDLLTLDRGMTPARRALEAAKADKGFVTRYLDGDRDAFAHMQSLIRAAYPEPEAPEADRAGTGAAAPMFEPWSPPDMGEGGGSAGWMPEWRGRASLGSGG